MVSSLTTELTLGPRATICSAVVLSAWFGTSPVSSAIRL